MLERKLFHELLKKTSFGSIDVTYWDGTTETYGTNQPKAGRLIFHDESALKAMMQNVDLGFGESYMDGTVDFEGDLSDLVYFGLKNKELFPELQGGMKVLGKFLRGFNKSTTVTEQRKDIHHHYDLGNDFFRLFLDQTMTYSCAYFRTATDSLETAQAQKVDHVLKKLRLKKGQHLLDIGSGWGQLILRAAELYGTTGYGITMSDEQVAETKRRIAEKHLEKSLGVELIDYRDHAKDHAGAYDAIASVGMFEHVGRPNLGLFMENAARMLKPGGTMLLHFITKPKEEVGGSFTLNYIFPGGYIPSVRETVALFPDYNFDLIDVENIRLHYALTLDAWSENFEKHLDDVRALFKAEKFKERWQGEPNVERFIRMWRLYLRGSAAGFRAGTIEVHQFLVTKGINDSLPLTREDWYK